MKRKEGRIEKDLPSIQAKKGRLLEMRIEGVISTAEFKQRNDGFNEQVKTLEEKRVALQYEAEKERQTTAQLEEIRSALKQELTFQYGANSALVTTILDKIVVKKRGTKEELHLDIYLTFGGPCGVIFKRENSSGRVLLQKTISTGIAQIENNGLMDRYLYTDSHEAIISDEMFMAVQQEKLTRTKNPEKVVAMNLTF